VYSLNKSVVRQVLHEAMSRCAAVLSGSTRAGDVSATVCAQCARCFAVAAAFPACRALAANMPGLCADLVPLLRRPVSALPLPPLAPSSVEAGKAH
jgi:hypothetical protein